MRKKIILSTILSMTILTNVNAGILEKLTAKQQDSSTVYKDIDDNFIKPYIVKMIEEKGFEFKENISDTENLKLDSRKIYVENDNKAILIAVQNKTNKAIDVEKEVGEGQAYPKILLPYGTGYLVISNNNSNVLEAYDTLSFNDKMVKTISEKNIVDLKNLFYSDIEIYKLNGVTGVQVVKENWIKDNITKTNFFLVDRVDRIIDENSNRFGLYVSGFVKVTDSLYSPMSYYFIVNQGKIVKIFEKDEYMHFDDFKRLLYALDK